MPTAGRACKERLRRNRLQSRRRSAFTMKGAGGKVQRKIFMATIRAAIDQASSSIPGVTAAFAVERKGKASRPA